MEYLIPVLVVAGAGILTVLVVAWANRSAKKNAANRPKRTPASSAGKPGDISPATAAQASARLDEKTHQQVYQRIVRGNLPQAAMLYQQATGLGMVQSLIDVQAMAAYPQQWVSLEEARAYMSDAGDTVSTELADTSDAGAGTSDLSEDAETPSEPDSSDGGFDQRDVTDLTVPSDWFEEEAPKPIPGFEVEVVRGDDSVRLSSDQLPPWLRDQFRAMLRDGRFTEAAEALAEHSELTLEEATDLIKILQQQQDDQ